MPKSIRFLRQPVVVFVALSADRSSLDRSMRQVPSVCPSFAASRALACNSAAAFQEFFCCLHTTLCLECQSCWLRLPFGNQLFCFLKIWFRQCGCHPIHLVSGR